MSDELAGFDFEVAVDDVDGEAVGGGEEREDALLLQGGEDELLLAGDFLGDDLLIILFAVEGLLLDELAELAVGEEDDEQPMALVELPQVGQLPLEATEPTEVGVKHEQAALADEPVDVDEQGGVVGLAEVGLLGIERLEDVLHLCGGLGGGKELVEVLVEGDEPSFVFLAHSDVAEHERRVDGIVEQGHAVEGLLHHPALVDEVEDLLRALVGVDVDHELVAPGAGLPVDGAVLVALHIVFDLLKLGVVAGTADALDAQLGEVVAHGEQFVAVEHEVAGIDLDIDGMVAGEASLDEAEHGGGEHAYAPEAVDAAPRGPQPVGDAAVAMGLQPVGEVDVAPLEDVGHLVDDMKLQGEGIVTADVQRDLVVVATREAVAALPRGGDAAAVT